MIHPCSLEIYNGNTLNHPTPQISPYEVLWFFIHIFFKSIILFKKNANKLGEKCHPHFEQIRTIVPGRKNRLATDTVMCNSLITDYKQAVCSHWSCKQKRKDLSSQPKYITLCFPFLPATFVQHISCRVCQSSKIKSTELQLMLYNQI